VNGSTDFISSGLAFPAITNEVILIEARNSSPNGLTAKAAIWKRAASLLG
jgi:hypothetical protein